MPEPRTVCRYVCFILFTLLCSFSVNTWYWNTCILLGSPWSLKEQRVKPHLSIPFPMCMESAGSSAAPSCTQRCIPGGTPWALSKCICLSGHLGLSRFPLGCPGSSAGKESAYSAEDLGLIPGLGRFPGEGNGYPLLYSGLENSMDCIVHGVTKSWTGLSDFHSLYFWEESENISVLQYSESRVSW